MKQWLAFSLLGVLITITAALGSPVAGRAASSGGKSPVAFVDPGVQADLRTLEPQETTSIIVKLRDQANLMAARGPNRAARLESVVKLLRAKADSSQQGMRAFLEEKLRRGDVKELVPLWIFNGLAVTATRDVVLELATRPDVLSIIPDRTILEPAMGAAGAADTTPPEASLTVIEAPAIWDLGFRGQGVVVANMDSGVDVNHPDLAAQWRGGSNSWFDPNGQHPSVPTDVSGHGTWTMGVLAGGDSGGTDIGVAPSSRWIAVKIFDDSGTARVSRIHAGFQWLLDPDGNPATPDAPHVVNNSWGFASPGCDLEFQPDLQALRAALITPVFAAGNHGPAAATSVSPANYPEALAVSATDNSDALYPYSSRGPSACGEPETTYPEVTAPGVSIRTSDLYGGYIPATGTSLAAPHVAGALAVLISAFPDVPPAQLEAALLATAVDLGLPAPDNDYGNGRIDVQAAFQWLSAQYGTPVLAGDVDCDHTVSMADASLIADSVIGLAPSLPCPEGADASRDGQTAMADALLVARVAAGLIGWFP